MTKLNESTRKTIAKGTAIMSIGVGGFIGGVISSIARNANPFTRLLANISGLAIGYTVAGAVYDAWAPLICDTANDIINLKKDIDDNPDIQKDTEKEKMDKVAAAVEKIKQRTQQEKESEKAYINTFSSAIKTGVIPVDSIPAIQIIGNCDECPDSETIEKDSVDISDITKE